MEATFYQHPTAIIDEGAQIGAGSRIWHFVHIMGGAKLGEKCVVGQNVFIGKGAVIGNRVKIQNNVSVYDSVFVEDDVFLGPSMVFTNVINPRSAVERKTEYLSTYVRRGASIGANATIICGIEIGKFAFIGAGAVVTKSVPDFALVTGNPGRIRGWMSMRGQKLNFDAEGLATCPEDGSRYQLKDERVVLL